MAEPAMPTMADVYADVERIIVRVPAEERPEKMRCTPRDAARWWITAVMQQHQPCESPVKHQVRGGDGYRWDWPYQRRVVDCLKLFLTLPVDFQHYIAAAAEDGIYWRGEHKRMFVEIVAETERMREVGSDSYRRGVLNRMRDFSLGEAA